MANPTTDAPVNTAKLDHQGRVLGLFGKVWDPGTVKTRLAKTLGAEKAARIYLQLLVLHLMRFANTSVKRIVAYSPATNESCTRFEDLTQSLKPQPDWDFVPQVESDLGTRMSSFFEQQFDVGAKGIVVIGSDAPRLTAELVDQAFESLTNHDVVFGPSTDGGYYLVGLSVMAKGIFQDVDWSTEKVLEQSLAKCESAGLSVALLPALTDIDHEEDLLSEITLLKPATDVCVQQFLQDASAILQGTES